MSPIWKNVDKAKALEVTLDTALKVLETTENVLNTTPIPGAAAVITIILDVVKRQERANKTSTLTAEQQERWKKLVIQMTSWETDLKGFPPEALSELRNASKELASRLQGFARKLEEAITHKIRPRWMTCADDEEALQEFLRKSNEAIVDYQYAQGDRIEKCVTEIRERIELLERNRLIGTLPRAELALYTADRSAGTLTSCAEGTREPLLEDVAKWVADPEAHKIYWLKERAGFGKTAVARSVAEQAAKEGTLAASFFFSYQITDLNHASRVITTVLYQLSLVGGAPYKQSLAEAIENHPNVLQAKLKDQLQPLFIDPLKHFNLASTHNPALIVVDALDECQREGAQDLISTFVAAVVRLDLPLKIFITSRPEQHLIDAFSDLGIKSRVIVDTSNEDVETYLRAELAEIPNKPGIKTFGLPRDWVKEEDIQALLERAGAKQVDSDSDPDSNSNFNFDSTSTKKALFVYIATVVRFLSDTDACDPQKHLQVLLSIKPSPFYRPYNGLDALYIRVLDLALHDRGDLLQRFYAVVGGMMAVGGRREAITVFEALLDLPRGEVRRTLVNLQSVIQYPNGDSTLPSFHHRSFTDFLTEKDRSGPQYYIDLQSHQKHFAVQCLRVIATSPLKEEVINTMNMDDYLFYPEPAFPLEFIHATIYLSYYCEQVKGNLDLLEELKGFIRDDFGWWIELSKLITSGHCHTISGFADPEDEHELPVLFRALVSSPTLRIVNKEYHVHALLRKELRRYISAVTQKQGGESRMETHALIKSIKKYIHEFKQIVDRVGDYGSLEEVCVAILAFAKDAEAAVDEYQLSIGDQAEVERSRKRTIFLRRQVEPLLIKHRWITEDEPFEELGIWTLGQWRKRGLRLG